MERFACRHSAHRRDSDGICHVEPSVKQHFDPMVPGPPGEPGAGRHRPALLSRTGHLSPDCTNTAFGMSRHRVGHTVRRTCTGAKTRPPDSAPPAPAWSATQAGWPASAPRQVSPTRRPAHSGYSASSATVRFTGTQPRPAASEASPRRVRLGSGPAGRAKTGRCGTGRTRRPEAAVTSGGGPPRRSPR